MKRLSGYFATSDMKAILDPRFRCSARSRSRTKSTHLAEEMRRIAVKLVLKYRAATS